MAAQSPYNNDTQTFGLDDDADVGDFMQRFSSPDTYVAPHEAQQRFDRYTQANHPEFQQAAGSYLSQMDPGHFAQAAQNMDQGQRASLAGGLLGALGNAGIDLGSIGRMLGLSTNDPQQMGSQDIGRLFGYAQQNAPGAVQQTAREQPFLLKALGNPMVQGTLAILAARYLAKSRR